MCDSLNRVGGMLNRYDIRRNIDLIRSLYPQVENIALVTDNTYGGISLQALVRAEWENYPDLNLVLVDSREGEETAFRTYATLPPRSAVMLGTWRVGSDGEYFMQRSLNDLVQNNPRVPVFSVTGTGIGDTAIGGYVPEYENGAEVIANQIRKYYDTDDIETLISIRAKVSICSIRASSRSGKSPNTPCPRAASSRIRWRPSCRNTPTTSNCWWRASCCWCCCSS